MSVVEGGSTTDVVVIGGGPTGLSMGVALAQLGHRVVVLEEHTAAFGLPRAGHVDGEVVRILQNLDSHRPLLKDATPYGDYTWHNAAGEVLFTINFGARSSSHWYSDYTIYQPTLEAGLLEAAAALPNLDLRYGQRVIGLTQDATQASLDIAARADGTRNTLIAHWVVAADGAGSWTREHLGISRDEQAFDSEVWLIVDAEIVRRWPGEGRGAQYCDPRRPAFETPLGRDHHRWEWSLRPGESHEEYLEAGAAWRLLADYGIGPEDVRIVRQQIYKFESRTAERWRDGRVLLAGDAAHTMPPFMGQGLCAGLRDVANLSWKLDLVLRGKVSASLLDTYEMERRPHAQTWADISREMGQISCTTDVQKAAERDAAFARGEASGPPPFPKLDHGVFAEGQAASVDAVGALLPQALVERGGSAGLFDDVVAAQFIVLVGGPHAIEVNAEARRLIRSLDAECLDLERSDEADGLGDIDGTYFRFLADLDAGAVVVRPDRYVFGVARTPEELVSVLDQLAAWRTASMPVS